MRTENCQIKQMHGVPFAVGIFALAFGLRAFIFQNDVGVGFLFFFPGAALAAVACSFPATLLYVVLATAFGAYWFIPPYEVFDMAKLGPSLAFVVSSLVIVGAIFGYKKRVAAKTDQLQAQLLEKEFALAGWHEATEQLYKFESLFQQTVDQAAVGIAHVAPDGRLLMLNKAFCDIVGYSSAELQRMTFRDITHPDYLLADIQLANELLDGTRQMYVLEKRYVRKDGAPVWVNLTTSLVRNPDGSPAFFVGVVENIGKRKEIEAALHESEEKFRNAFSNAAIPVAVTRPSGQFVEVNDAYCRLTGYNAEELRSIGFHRLVQPEDSAVNQSLHEAMLDGRIGHFVLENRYVHKSGREIWVRKSISVVRDEAKRPRWVVALVENIQERKEAEAAVRLALEESRRANESKSRFLAAASHDLRQPLSALSIYASSLKGAVSEVGQPMLANLKACVVSLSELLNDLLDLSKLQAGVVTPAPSNFALAELFHELQSIHRPQSIAKGLSLRFRETRFVGRTDRILFRQIVGNFVANAIRYCDGGRVLVGCRQHEGRAWVEVWDTGIGIPENRMADIFEEFVQLDDSRSRGSGLGLAIVAKTASLLGLKTRVKSHYGSGSMFAIELPKGAFEHIDAPSEHDWGSYTNLKIALIEDNQAVLNALRQGLQSVGHQVVAAPSQKDLLELIENYVPDVVISDYRLGEGATGIDVIAEMRTRIDPGLPAILITGDTDPHLVRSMADSGIVILHKPIDLETLLAYLEDVTASRPLATM